MATKLTSSYQYIGRSNAVSCPAGWNYYILLYAKTSGDISTGKHTVSIQMRLGCTSNSSFYLFSTSAYAKADGVTAFSWSGEKIPASYWGDSSSLTAGGVTYRRWVTLKEGTAVVNTGFGEDKTITIDGSWVMNESNSNTWFPYTGKYAKASIDVVLPMIAGASTITSASNATIGGTTNIVWKPLSKSFYYKVKLAIGDWSWTSGAIHPDQTSDYTYTTPKISYNTANELPNATSGTMTATLYTYSDSACSKQIGSASSKTFTLTVPDNDTTKPEVAMSLAPVSSLGSAFSGLYIQGKTKVKATLSAEGQYDATIKSYSMKVEGKTYDSGDSYTSGYLPNSGSVTVYGYAKDSRGYTGSTSKKITVIGYSSPKILNVYAKRCDANGNLSDSGTYLKIRAKRSYSPVISGDTQKNFCLIRYRYKAASASSYSSWTTILAKNNLSSDEITTGALLGGVLALDSSYLVQVQAVDDVGSNAYTTITVPTDKVHTHKTKNGMGFGKYCEGENLMDVGWDAHFHGDVKIGEMTLRDYILAVINEGG